MWLSLCVALAALGQGTDAASSDQPVLEMSKSQAVALMDVDVPAEEPGSIRKFLVREGQTVRAGDLLVQMNDDHPLLAKRAAEFKRDAAKKQAESDVEIEYAKAQYRVAKKEWENALEVNQKAPNAIPAREVDRLKLAAERAAWSIKKAVMDREVAELTAQGEGAEVEAAELAIRRRQIKSPIDGIVVELVKQDGEWAAAGETLVRIVRIDELRVKGSFDPTLYSPQWLANAEVTFTVHLPGGAEEFIGRIEYVSPALVRGSGNCEVWALIQNRQHAGHWLLRDGMLGTMTARLEGAPQVGAGAVAPSAQGQANGRSFLDRFLRE